jgi:tRNA threonylcarbamoyladenosine biosynthesis protein TsaE
MYADYIALLEKLSTGKPFKKRSQTSENIRSFAHTLAQAFLAMPLRPWLLCLQGDLGAGKTTFVKGLAEGLGFKPEEIQSPTFAYLNIHEHSSKAFSIFHFDLYRLTSSQDFCAMGFEEYFYEPGLCCIEWPERITGIVPKPFLKIEFYNDEIHQDRRHLSLSIVESL